MGATNEPGGALLHECLRLRERHPLAKPSRERPDFKARSEASTQRTTSDNCLGFGHLHCYVHVDTRMVTLAHEQTLAPGYQPLLKVAGTARKVCCLCNGHKHSVPFGRVAVSCPGRKPKRIAPFL